MTMTIGVVGAGTIGRGVAQTFAEGDFDVVLVDVDDRHLEAAMEQIASDLRAQALFGRGRPAHAASVIARITPTIEIEALSSAEYVVENVTENWEIKRDVHRRLDQTCRGETIIAVNTSAIPITRIAAQTGRPDSVVGAHFMNPVPLMDTVELIRGYHTSDATVDATVDLLKQVGKSAVIVNDGPGFVTNRVLMLTINEAIFCVQDGVATAEDVDRISRGCFGYKMGPLETADLIGLDTVLNSIMVLYDSFRDSKYRPAPLLRRMVDAGLLGHKTGKGFYEYR